MRVLSDSQKYCDQVFGLRDTELERIRENMNTAGVAFRSLSPSEARILIFLIQAFAVKKIVEIGTLYGYSAIAMSKAMGSSGRLFTVEKNPKAFALAQQNFKSSSVANQIVAYSGDAKEVLPNLENEGPFDLIFIDANKSAYAEYLDWAEENVIPGGLIIGDNTFLRGGVWAPESVQNLSAKQVRAMRDFNLRLADPKRYNSMIIPTVEGLTVAQRLV